MKKIILIISITINFILIDKAQGQSYYLTLGNGVLEGSYTMYNYTEEDCGNYYIILDFSGMPTTEVDLKITDATYTTIHYWADSYFSGSPTKENIQTLDEYTMDVSDGTGYLLISKSPWTNITISWSPSGNTIPEGGTINLINQNSNNDLIIQDWSSKNMGEITSQTPNYSKANVLIESPYPLGRKLGLSSERISCNSSLGISALSNIYQTANRQYFKTGTTTAMTLYDGGKVGIGITIPEEKLHLNDGQFKITNDDGTYNRRRKIDGMSDVMVIESNNKNAKRNNQTYRVNYGDTGAAPTDAMVQSNLWWVAKSSGNFSMTNTIHVVGNPDAGIMEWALRDGGETSPRFLSFTKNKSYVTSKFGIGTSPEEKLHISSVNDGDAVLLIESDKDNNNESDNPSVKLKQDGGAVVGIIGLNGNADAEYTDAIANNLYLKNSHVDFGIQLVTNNKAGFTLLPSGNVAIGKTSADYKLDVAGAIRAEEILVEANGNTADFVFEETYNLRDLSELEAFIKENKHLPEIPSAEAMEAQGVNLAEMNKLLLQKVEELTLYTIQQQVVIQTQDKKLAKIEGERNKEQGEREKLEEALSKEQSARGKIEARLERIEKLLLEGE